MIRYRSASTLLGRFRQWWLHRVLHRAIESCDRCGRRVRNSWWCADPDQWERVYERATGVNRSCSGLLCERCFDRFAESRRDFVHWQAHVIDRERPVWPEHRWRQG